MRAVSDRPYILSHRFAVPPPQGGGLWDGFPRQSADWLGMTVFVNGLHFPQRGRLCPYMITESNRKCKTEKYMGKPIDKR